MVAKSKYLLHALLRVNSPVTCSCKVVWSIQSSLICPASVIDVRNPLGAVINKNGWPAWIDMCQNSTFSATREFLGGKTHCSAIAACMMACSVTTTVKCKKKRLFNIHRWMLPWNTGRAGETRKPAWRSQDRTKDICSNRISRIRSEAVLVRATSASLSRTHQRSWKRSPGNRHYSEKQFEYRVYSTKHLPKYPLCNMA